MSRLVPQVQNHPVCHLVPLDRWVLMVPVDQVRLEILLIQLVLGHRLVLQGLVALSHRWGLVVLVVQVAQMVLLNQDFLKTLKLQLAPVVQDCPEVHLDQSVQKDQVDQVHLECPFPQQVHLVHLVRLVQLDLWVQVVQTDHCCLQGQEVQAVPKILLDLRHLVNPGHLLFQQVPKVQVILQVQQDQAVLSHPRALAVQKVLVVLPVLKVH